MLKKEKMGDMDNNSSAMATLPSASDQEATVSSAGNQNQTLAPQVVPIKKKRNLPGMPGMHYYSVLLMNYTYFFGS